MDQSLIEKKLSEALSEGLGLDLSDPNLSGTPKRIAKMWTEEFFSSLDTEEGFNNLATFPNEHKYSQLILLDRIHFVSICSHHFLPFSGLAWVAYLPCDKLVGASKPARLISFFSKKPQLQENLCHEFLKAFDKAVQPKGAMVVMRGIHGCMSDRGVLQYNGAGMTTSALCGDFLRVSTLKQEAMDLIKLSLMVHSL